MVILKKQKKVHLWMETPDGDKIRYCSTVKDTKEDRDRALKTAKENAIKNLKKTGGHYTIDQFKFYFE